MLRRLVLIVLTLLTLAGPVCAGSTPWCETTCRRVGDTTVCETWCL